jgi:3-dehydroquinate dehydratase type I
MICVSVAERDFGRCRDALLDSELAELRIDQTDFSEDEVQELFALPVDIIATCRPGTKSLLQRTSLLLAAISSGAAYVDIEVDADINYFHTISDTAKQQNCRLIVSHHNWEHTPQMAELEKILALCFRMGADIAKIACHVHSFTDCARILSLYQKKREIIAFGLGKMGTFTRIASLFLGAPFTYAALAPGKETADGQLDRQRLQTILDALDE